MQYPNQNIFIMKTIKIRKSLDFSAKSKVFLHSGRRKTHIKGFGSFSIPIEEGEECYASHLWTSSKKIPYKEMTETSLLIKPRMDKVFAFVVMMICIVCMTIFILTQTRWPLYPMIPIIIYVILYISVLKNRYLIIKPDKEEPETVDTTK
jgi:hypothetical protein